jgi:hypothetical protein
MRKLLMLIPSFLILSFSNAQNGNLFLSYKGGYGVNRISYAGFSFDYSTRYNAQNEIFAEFHSDNENHYHTFLAGYGTKAVVARSINTALRLIFGMAIGSNFQMFIAAPHAGFELSQTLQSRIDLFLGNKNQILLWAPPSQRWRFMVFGGVRFPLN